MTAYTTTMQSHHAQMLMQLQVTLQIYSEGDWGSTLLLFYYYCFIVFTHIYIIASYGTWHGKLNFSEEFRVFSTRTPADNCAERRRFSTQVPWNFRAGGRGFSVRAGADLPCRFRLKRPLLHVPTTKYKIIPNPNPNPNTKMTVNTVPRQM